jgi:hypothetical protein
VAQGGDGGSQHQEDAPMSDLLLEWMSYRREGRFEELPAHLNSAPPRRVIDDLSTLAHIETVSPSSWRIAPPVLAGLPSDQVSQEIAVLCGARTPGVLSRIANACGKAGAEMRTTAIPDRPSLVQIVCPSKATVAEVAAEAGVPLQREAAYTLLACLPAIRDWPRSPCPMVAGKVPMVRRFSPSKMQWLTSSLAEASAARTGFFRIQRDWDWVSILKSRKSDCAYIDDRAGRLFVAAKLRAAAWDAGTRTLSLPIQLYPPSPIARALALCSGTLPRYDAVVRRLSFGGISPAMVRLTLNVTGLRLA